ncbi:MAG: SAVED domain-containing protein [Pusillimonas sp.]|nr:MAG: SAVED domain-containing protein [Pusillimonas sp.]
MLILANGFTVRALTEESKSTRWVNIGTGEFGSESKKATGPLLRNKRLLWAHTSELPTVVDAISSSQIQVATAKLINTWQDQATRLTVKKGRQEVEASPATRQEVASLAAWRCQFPGCGENLREHFPTGQRGNYGYFAHIVASSPEGPRGDIEDSPRLANDPTNLLLLCDGCHRLIDRISPAEYGVERLRDIRTASIAEVSRLLDSLRYRSVRPIFILGNITGQVAYISPADIAEALWSRKLRSVKGDAESFFHSGTYLHKVHTATYWNALFEVLRQDIPVLQRYLNGSGKGGASREELAIFPLHSTSVLILAGRILGDNAGIHLFQPHRNKNGENASVTRWAWPTQAQTPAPDKYKMRISRDKIANSNEACLLISITFSIDHTRLPEHCYCDGQLQLPTVEVFVDEPNSEAISHPEDLAQFGTRLNDALRKLQDDFGIEKVHLFVGAPTTAAVVVGQKMQARHQATFVCHEAIGGPKAPFLPTIEISSTQVQELASGATCSLQP